MIMYVSVEEGSPGTGSGGSANFYIFRNRFARTGANPWIPPHSGTQYPSNDGIEGVPSIWPSLNLYFLELFNINGIVFDYQN